MVQLKHSQYNLVCWSHKIDIIKNGVRIIQFRFVYYISGDTSNHFVVDGFDIKVNTPSSLDFETTPTYLLTVRTTDSGGLYDDALLVVNIISANEATPIFSTADDSIEIAEDTAVGASLFT